MSPVRRNAPPRYRVTGQPAISQNKNLLDRSPLERYAAGQRKTSQEADPVESGTKTYRRRAEVFLQGPEGILAILKPGYLLVPGGGLDVDESPADAAKRETLEEAGRRIRDLRPEGSIKSVPSGRHPIAKGADGVETFFFTAEDAGPWKGQHPDREDFGWVSIRDVLDHLAKCLVDPRQEWQQAMNGERIRILAELGEKVRGVDKQAGVPEIRHLHPERPIPDTPQKAVMFDLDGTLRDWEPAGAHRDPEAIKILPDRIPVLKALRESGYRVIGATNHTRHGQDLSPEALEACQHRTCEDLDHHLEDVFWASEPHEALLKPHPALLQAAMEKYRIDPEQAVYVGDSPKDQEAAHRAGIQFVHVEEMFGPQAPRTGRSPWGLENKKVADAPHLIPRQEFLTFTPDGKLIVRPTGAKRFDFPTQGEGRRVPYSFPIRYLPAQGVPEPGAHGYEVNFLSGETNQVPEGYEARDPQEVLKGIYGAMGLAANREHQALDRGRVQALLRTLRLRQKAHPVHPPVPETVHPPAPETVPGAVLPSVPTAPSGNPEVAQEPDPVQSV